MPIRSLFEPEVRERIPWQSYLTSAAIHSVVAAAILAISVPALHELKRTTSPSVGITPDIPFYRPQITHPKLTVAKTLPAVPKINRPPIVTPPVIQPAPERVPEKPVAVPPKIEVANALPSTMPLPALDKKAPAPQIRTDTFASADVRKQAEMPKELNLGAFGDPNGAHVTTQRQSGVQIARVGAFDAGPSLPGASPAGGGNRFVRGAFDSAQASPTATNGGTGNIQVGQFGDSKLSRVQPTTMARTAAQPHLTPVEILSKPKPAYTAEARSLKIEGQVTLEVVFLSNGEVRIIRVLHGLGHGLDEAAQEAAQRVRFRPAMRDGVAIDTSATIYINFEIT